MSVRRTESNPLKVLAYGFSVRSLAGIGLGIWLILGSAPDVMGYGSSSSGVVLAVGLLLLALGLVDGTLAIRMAFPVEHPSAESIVRTCNKEDIARLIESDIFPNDRYLSRLGHWLTRLSDRFATLPVPYQKLLELALVPMAFIVVGGLIVGLGVAFATSGSRPDLARSFLSAAVMAATFLSYAYWIAAAKNIFGAAEWANRLTVRRILQVIIGVLATLIVGALAGHVELDSETWLQPWTIVGVGGTVFLLIAIGLIVKLRSSHPERTHGRSLVSKNLTASIHPDTLVSALRSAIEVGFHVLIEDGDLSTSEHHSMSGGTFSARVVGEYDIKREAPSRSARTGGAIFGTIGIALVALGYVMLVVAVRSSSLTPALQFLAFYLFGNLAVVVSMYPLVEVSWSSYLMRATVSGNFQGAGVNSRSDGSFMTRFKLDGGLAAIRSVSYPNAAIFRAKAARYVASALPSASEKQRFMAAFDKDAGI